MNGYQSPYERSRSLQAMVKPLLIIGAVLIAVTLGVLWAVDYIMGQQIEVLRSSFSDQEIKQMDDTYHVVPEDALTPLYTFEQGDSDSRLHYTGIVMRLEADVADVLKDCFDQDPDGEMYLNNYNNFQDYFVDDSYGGDTETLLTEQGRVKGIRCKTDFPDYAYFFFEQEGVYYLMARRNA